MSPGPALSQKLGPAGINMGKVIQQVNDATKDFRGLRVPVELDVNTSSKNFKVKVFSPPVSELLKKELGIPKGSGLQDKEKVANASIEQIISVSKQKMPDLLCKDLKSAVKTVVGTCVSLGVLIDNKLPKQVENEINNGVYDKEISQVKTQTSPEKKKELESFFSDIKSKQEQLKKEAEKAAEEAEKAKTASPEAEKAATPGKVESTPTKK